MDPTMQVLFGWLVFGGSHTALSHPPVRVRLVSRFGERGFQLLYSLVAVTTFVPLVFTFFSQRIASPIPLPALIRIPGPWWLTMALMFVALNLMAHLLVNFAPIDRAFFGGAAAYSILGCAHQDWRRRRAAGSAREGFFAETSFLPFVAILQGRNRLVVGELRPGALAAAAAVFVALFFVHHRIFA